VEAGQDAVLRHALVAEEGLLLMALYHSVTGAISAVSSHIEIQYFYYSKLVLKARKVISSLPHMLYPNSTVLRYRYCIALHNGGYS